MNNTALEARKRKFLKKMNDENYLISSYERQRLKNQSNSDEERNFIPSEKVEKAVTYHARGSDHK